MSLKFLTVGLPADDDSIPAHIRAQVADMLNKADADFKHYNYPIEHIDATPTDQSTLIQRLQSQPVHAVVIGNGIRSNMKLTHFLEQLIDIIHTHAPQCKVLFNTTPMDVPEAIQRWFPQLKKVS